MKLAPHVADAEGSLALPGARAESLWACPGLLAHPAGTSCHILGYWHILAHPGLLARPGTSCWHIPLLPPKGAPSTAQGHGKGHGFPTSSVPCAELTNSWRRSQANLLMGQASVGNKAKPRHWEQWGSRTITCRYLHEGASQLNTGLLKQRSSTNRPTGHQKDTGYQRQIRGFVQVNSFLKWSSKNQSNQSTHHQTNQNASVFYFAN